MPRRTFSRDEKLVAVRSVLGGGSVKEVADGLDLHQNVLRRWLKAYQAGGEPAFALQASPVSGPEQEVVRLRREVARLKAERRRAPAQGPQDGTSETKSLLLNATETIMVEDGYAAVSTRSVARKAGVTPALVHYYFATTDDLLLAAFRRKKVHHDERVRAALAAPNPVRALWNFYTDQERNAIGIEFRAMSNHRKAIRSELARDIEESRREQVAGLTAFLRRTQADRLPSAVCLVMIIVGMGRSFVAEEVIGATYGHAETKMFFERLLDELDALVATDPQPAAAAV